MTRIIPKDRHDPQAFSRRFRMLMAYHNLTLQKIAQFTDNAISTVGTWKNGRLPASMSTIEKLAQLFQISSDYLLTGSTAEADSTHHALIAILRTEGTIHANNNAANAQHPGQQQGMHAAMPFQQQMPQHQAANPFMAAPAAHANNGPWGSNFNTAPQQSTPRSQSEAYMQQLQQYLDKSQHSPEALEHTWSKIRELMLTGQ